MAAASVADAPEASSQTSPPPAKVPFDVARTDGVQVTRVFWLSNVPQEADDARRILADFAATFREQYIDRGGDARLSAQGDTSGFMLEYQMLRHFLPLFVDEQVAEEYPNSAAAQAYRARYKKDKDRPKVSLTGALLSQCFRFAVSPLPPSVLQQLIVARKTIWTLLLSNEKERIIEVFRDLPSPVTTDMLAFLNFALTIHPRCNAWVYSTAPKVGMKKVKMPNGDWTEVDDSGDIVFPVSIGFNADERKISSKWYDDNFDLAAETERECEELETNPPWDKVGIPIGTKGDNDGCQVLRSQCFWCRSCVLAQGTGKLSRCAGCLVPVYWWASDQSVISRFLGHI